MEFFQELTFTAFLALILSYAIAKIIFFAVSNSRDDDNASVCSSNEGTIAKDVTFSKGLRVKSVKSKKRVQFVDDVVIRSVDRYENEKGSENLEKMDAFRSLVVEKGVDEKTVERVEIFGDNGLSEGCGVNSDVEDKGSEDIEMLNEEKCEGAKINGEFEVKEETLVTDGLSRVVVDNSRNEVLLESDDLMIDQKEGNGELGSAPEEGLSSGDVGEEAKVRADSGDDVNEEGKVRDDESGDDVNEEEKVRDNESDDDWEGIERSELEKIFAEAVNYLEYGFKRNEKGEDQMVELGNDVQMKLYGLHKVAVEGPCHEPQPMALKMAARAKWNAWQRLGSMSQEAAMEQYIKILAESAPGWNNPQSVDDNIHVLSQSETETPGDSGSHLVSVIEDKSKLE